MSAFLLFRHSTLSPLTQKSISVTLNQFANYNKCAIASAPFRNDSRTSGSRRHNTGKHTVIAQHCSLHERSLPQQRQVLAGKKVEPIKCSAHIWVDCHL